MSVLTGMLCAADMSVVELDVRGRMGFGFATLA